MGFINELFATEESVSAKFYSRADTSTAGMRADPTYTLLMTKDVLFWQGSAADSIVSDRIRADVSGVIVIDYEDYTSTVDDIDKVTIDSVDYSIIHVENIGNQNVVLQIPVKKYA